jgi:demethylmenaquinone methyltransferase/2-methoxy-6-polyprenyl-1,4-benzoquinol methylase
VGASTSTAGFNEIRSDRTWARLGDGTVVRTGATARECVAGEDEDDHGDDARRPRRRHYDDDVAFARDPATAAYYDRRAAEYDDWYEGTGLFASRSRPGWQQEVAEVVALVAGLAPARTLDVACGTAYLTRHLRGYVVALDQSPAMVAIAQRRLPDGLAVAGDGLAPPFADDAFDRVLTGHFYGHLPPDERGRFLAGARRVAAELVVIDTALRPGVPAEGYEERRLNDGSTHRIFKRYLEAPELAAELGGEVLYTGRWFVAARAVRPGPG